MLGTELEPEGGVPPCSQTQGAPTQVAGEVESVAQNLEKIKEDKLKPVPPKILQEFLFCDSFILDPKLCQYVSVTFCACMKKVTINVKICRRVFSLCSGHGGGSTTFLNNLPRQQIIGSLYGEVCPSVHMRLKNIHGHLIHRLLTI